MSSIAARRRLVPGIILTVAFPLDVVNADDLAPSNTPCAIRTARDPEILQAFELHPIAPENFSGCIHGRRSDPAEKRAETGAADRATLYGPMLQGLSMLRK
jgi:hypothetical protein